MRSFTWVYVIEATDRCGIMRRENFVMEPDWRARIEQVRSAGYYKVRWYKRRALTHGQPSTRRSGHFLDTNGREFHRQPLGVR